MAEQKKQNLSDPKVRKRFITYKEATELYSMGLVSYISNKFIVLEDVNESNIKDCIDKTIDDIMRISQKDWKVSLNI